MGALMRLRELFFTPNGHPRLLLPALVAVVVTFALGWAAMRAVQQTLPDEQRAMALARTGKFGAAETLYVRLLREKPSVTTAVALIENHQRANAMKQLHSITGKRRTGPAADASLGASGVEAVMTEEALDELLEKSLAPEVALVMRYWRAVDTGDVPSELRDTVLLSATIEPPLPWYNHALGREAVKRKDLDEAAMRFEREGLAFPERHEDIDRASTFWMANDAWDHVRKRMEDPRVAAAADR